MSLTRKLILSATMVASLCGAASSFAADTPAKPISVAVSTAKVSAAAPAGEGIEKTFSNIWHHCCPNVN